MTAASSRIHEVDFCAQIAGSANELITQDPSTYPFSEARVEGFGSGASKRKRKDLRFVDREGRLVLCGEVKLPGTPEGRSAVHHTLVTKAASKADDGGVQYFFTWNVNEFALWDRSLWDRPWFERRVRLWRLSRNLKNSEDVGKEDNLRFIKTRFLPGLLSEIAGILSGRRRDWGMPPDDLFIRSLESHLEWPVQLVQSHVLERVSVDRAFDLRVQQWMMEQDWPFIRSQRDEWVKAVENMVKTLVYVWSNRLIFYQALRARFPTLPRLRLKLAVKTANDAVDTFNNFFSMAVERSGDYEPLLMPETRDWATALVFQPDNALQAWRGLLKGIEAVDFSSVPSDVVGRIFQKLIGPEERHRYGQHFTGDDVVDLINTFCIRSGRDVVLDPACGSGSFLVRAYYRKKHLEPDRAHLDLISDLFGCDIALYPAHLATLNLAAREINDETNYPRITRRNFFDFDLDQPFCELPDSLGARHPITLPRLDALVGNPPYVRQEKLEKADKARFGRICRSAWPGLQLTGRSDLHCYFWPVAARLVRPNGYFGFLTSSSWMDVEYGFALQGWMLRHFRVLAIMESATEPWFEDARVKTCVTILQRCDDRRLREDNVVRFVRFSRPLSNIIGIPPGQNEKERQLKLEGIRDSILEVDEDCQNENFRIIAKTQKELWRGGMRAAVLLKRSQASKTLEDADSNWVTPDDGLEEPVAGRGAAQTYGAGKWGRYVRAPDFYFEVMSRYGKQFVPLGEIAAIRRGITSGCDAFFMPKDISTQMLQQHQADRAFREQTGVSRSDVESGKLRILQAGDGSLHPVETRYVSPEVHSLMKVTRPVIRSGDVDRVVLLVREDDNKKGVARWVRKYLRYGMTATFPSAKSKGLPVPKRSTCAARNPWYDLTRLIRPGFAFWPKAQQYRHIIPANPDRMICNCNLYDIGSDALSATEQVALVASLNSTIVGFFKTFYGRFAGTEGNLKTEVVDVNLMEVPDPRGVSKTVSKRLELALDSLTRRESGRFVEEQLMDCHSPERARNLAAGPLVLPEELRKPDRRELDDAVFEMLGVSDSGERCELIDRLYEATSQHFRDIRVVEIEKMVQRAKSDRSRLSVHDLAADIWDAVDRGDSLSVCQWLTESPQSNAWVNMPEERPAVLLDSPLFPDHTVYFGRSRKEQVHCGSRGQAQLVLHLATLGVSGRLKIPGGDEAAKELLSGLEARLSEARRTFRKLVESRTGNSRIRKQLLDVLQLWFVHGRAAKRRLTTAITL